MKICVIGTVGVPATYGGFETLVENLIKKQLAEFYVYCSSKHYSQQIKEYNGAKLIYISLNANGVSSIFYDFFSIIHALLVGHRNFLILGVSGAIFFPIIKLFPGARLVTNLDGIEWKREKWRGFAKNFLKLSEYLAVKFSDVVVSDNASITEYIKKKYKRDSRTIAYGGDHAIISPCSSKKLSNLGEELKYKYALSLCRIEPENNIHTILDAFTRSELPLIFIGNWKSSEYGIKLYEHYKDFENIKLLMPIYCLDTLYIYRSLCAVYLHGHSAGGTNPSLVEMMHFSKPIIAYDCSFNRASMENRGNYFLTSDDLYTKIDDLDALETGNALKEIASTRYTWDHIRTQYINLFKTQRS